MAEKTLEQLEAEREKLDKQIKEKKKERISKLWADAKKQMDALEDELEDASEDVWSEVKQVVARWQGKLGMSSKSKTSKSGSTRRVISEETKRKIAKEKKAGKKSVKQISEENGVAVSQVYAYAKKYS
ncbi:hypothetical protein PVV74_04345 [Roseovarius sp. SK2]|uniref:hypothetical protein n=1 Tax=Roseovarius TaxID=74030 RepID=UPI00237C11FD|nr:hypothetical protein [Roseovarius sp. SK2]MDD9724678.1 hypothetical protein [Roseovarius sp. SK2]